MAGGGASNRSAWVAAALGGVQIAATGGLAVAGLLLALQLARPEGAGTGPHETPDDPPVAQRASSAVVPGRTFVFLVENLEAAVSFGESLDGESTVRRAVGERARAFQLVVADTEAIADAVRADAAAVLDPSGSLTVVIDLRTVHQPDRWDEAAQRMPW